MAQDSTIEWTDATWNPVRGCSRISTGCGGANHQGGCYAEKIAARFSGPGQAYEGLAERTPHGGRWTGAIRLAPDQLEAPLRWKKPRRIFVNSMSDLFHENLGEKDIAAVFNVMAACPQHTFQVLTKRAARMRQVMAGPKHHELWSPKLWHRSVLPNVWLGVSVEDQAAADSRIPHLLNTPAAVRFLSCEPLLGPVDLEPWLRWPDGVDLEVNEKTWGCPSCDAPCPDCPTRKAVFVSKEYGPYDQDGTPSHVHTTRRCLDWVISGGESGPRARPMHPAWAKSLRDQCVAAGTPFFFKQWGEWAPGENADGPQTRTEQVATWADGEWLFGRQTPAEGAETHRDDEPDLFRFGKKSAGRHLDGQLWNQFPEAA